MAGRILFRAGGIGASVLCCAVAVAGCSASSPATARPSTPGDVALAFTHDMCGHHLKAAGQLVLPADRELFGLISRLIANQPTSCAETQVGSTTETGQTADVILTGTFCGTNGATGCFSNTDPYNADPRFLIALTALDGRWYVHIPTTPTPGIDSTAGASAV